MGLYDDDNAAITAGDLADVIYWQTKFAHLKLEAALKSRQPEYAVRGLIPSVVSGAADLLKTYPNHAEVKAWHDRAKAIEPKIDPNAAPADFRADFAHWKDYSYEAGWRSYHMAKAAAAKQDNGVALSHAKEVVVQFGRTVDRMAAWPADVQAFVRSAAAEMEAMKAALSK
ncbi:MAG TPA: hypothetical protein VF796_13980 [Humisphaera sp.]